MDILAYLFAIIKAKAYTDSVIASIPKGMTYKGGVDYQASLPSNASSGDCYTVKYKGTTGTEAWGAEFVWGTYEGTNQWIRIGADAASKWGEIEGTLSQQTDLQNALNTKESSSNKVTSISAQSTDTQYPSAKCVYDIVGNVESALEALL